MLFKNELVTFFLVILSVKLILSSSVIEDKMLIYERNVNTSLQLEKKDKVILRSWSEDFQVRMVEVTAKYRLDMIRHQQNNFGSQLKNKRWQECLKCYERTTNKLEQAYYIKENACLRNASAADGDQRDLVLRMGERIQEWRRTYRDLLKLCHDKRESKSDCINNHMERGYFPFTTLRDTFSVILDFRILALRRLREAMTRAIVTLEECLQATLSGHLESIQHAKDVMSKCYG